MNRRICEALEDDLTERSGSRSRLRPARSAPHSLPAPDSVQQSAASLQSSAVRAQQDHAARLKEKGKEHANQVYVFRDAGRDPQHNYRRWFNEALTEAKIKDYSWHCNRHTFASRLVMAGVDLRTVAELMGHSSIQMTMRYAHLAPQHNRAAVDRLVSVSEPRKTRRAAKRKNELVTKAVTSKTTPSRQVAENLNKSLNNIDLQIVAP